MSEKKNGFVLGEKMLASSIDLTQLITPELSLVNERVLTLQENMKESMLSPETIQRMQESSRKQFAIVSESLEKSGFFESLKKIEENISTIFSRIDMSAINKAGDTLREIEFPQIQREDWSDTEELGMIVRTELVIPEQHNAGIIQSQKQEIIIDLEPIIEEEVKKRVDEYISEKVFPALLKSDVLVWEDIKLLIDMMGHRIYYFIHQGESGDMTFMDAGLTVRGNAKNLSNQGRMLLNCATYRGALIDKKNLQSSFKNPTNVISKFNNQMSQLFCIKGQAIVNYSPMFYRLRLQIQEL